MLELTGSAWERGCQHGETRRAAIRDRIARGLDGFGDAASRTAWERRAAPWWAAIQCAAPLIATEIRGIAAASRSSVTEIVLLNAFEAVEPADQRERGGCTAVGVPTPGGSVVAQNWDADEPLATGLEIHHHRGPDTGDLVVLASPGGLGWAGMNAFGLALVNNDLLTTGTRPGVPSQVMRRLVLAAASLPGALETLQSHPAAGGRAYLLGDQAGRLATVEVAAHHRQPEIVRHAAATVHTNHALTEPIRKWESRRLIERHYPSTFARHTRATELVAGCDGTMDGIHAVLADHESFPLSICRHPSEAEPTVTAAALIFDCAAKAAGIWLGNPCEGPRATLTLRPAPE